MWQKRKKQEKIFYSDIDGSHWQTENNYTIVVYYREWDERFDRLIGSATVNSIRAIQ